MVKKIAFVLIPFLVLIAIYFSIKDTPIPQPQKRVVVYTYSSFASSWGAGVQIQKKFEEATGIHVEFVDVGEAGVILQRLILEGNTSPADFILGLDQFSLSEAQEKASWLQLPALSMSWDRYLPEADREIQQFRAYNWSPMAFVYREKELTPPKKLEDLAGTAYAKSLSLMDARTSSPGYIFFHWILQKLGVSGTQEYFKKIKNTIVTVSPSWSAAYGLFTKKQARLVFSYLTSPVYHWLEEKEMSYQPVYLEEAHPYHVEYFAIPTTCKNCEAAKLFADFLYLPEIQKIIMQKNYMLPVISGVVEATEFEKLKIIPLFHPTKQIPRSEVIEIWKSLQL